MAANLLFQTAVPLKPVPAWSASAGIRWKSVYWSLAIPPCSGSYRKPVGLYLNPPEHALVLSVDEKSEIEALDDTQPE